ncbi:MAG: nucleotidyltransferase family protein [Alphaproteobacteria bacterium]|nr:nucleotidyltransferase family protein [Alphaproteobacteria bacterium]
MAYIKKAMILAAGRGVRMRELTQDKPKPLVAVNHKPLIDYIVEKLDNHGIQNLVVNLCYKGEMIQQNLSRYHHLNIQYSIEEEALETGGGVKKALPLLGDNAFFVVNADPLWIDKTSSVFSQLEAAWNPKQHDVLLALIPVKNARGDVKDGNYFIENNKPRRQTKYETNIPYLFTGIQIINPCVFDKTPNGAFSLRDIYDDAQHNNRLGCIIYDGIWYHVGTPEALSETEHDLKELDKK